MTRVLLARTRPLQTTPHGGGLGLAARVGYWVTSSAVANSVSGTVRPSALAVLRLMTSSSLVACWTGRSAGFSPLYGALEVKHYFTAFSTSLIPVSLFDLKSRFFAPTHMCWRPARTGAVKVGHRSTLATRSVVSRPRLDRPEHGGTLGVVGMTCSRGARCRGTRGSRRNLVSGGSL